MHSKLRDIIGECPSGTKYKERMRFHQGWWRAFVLACEEGKRPLSNDESKTICNTIKYDENDYSNFLSPNIKEAIQQTIDERKSHKAGIFLEKADAKKRFYSNLLSSQPVVFNFFGELKMDKKLATKVFQSLYPSISITSVEWIKFEWTPEEDYLSDRSAFDVVIEVRSGEQKGLIGFECKYTDEFSSQRKIKDDEWVFYGDVGCKNYDAYKSIFDQSADHFSNDYYYYVKSKELNQLFRNELIAQSLLKKNQYDFVHTGLFCYEDDDKAKDAGKKLQQALSNGKDAFRILTYYQFIETMQRLSLTPSQRELTMMLWARYCGLKLSDRIYCAIQD